MVARNHNFFFYFFYQETIRLRDYGFIAHFIWLLCIGYLIRVCVKTYIIKLYKSERERDDAHVRETRLRDSIR